MILFIFSPSRENSRKFFAEPSIVIVISVIVSIVGFFTFIDGYDSIRKLYHMYNAKRVIQISSSYLLQESVWFEKQEGESRYMDIPLKELVEAGYIEENEGQSRFPTFYTLSEVYSLSSSYVRVLQGEDDFIYRICLFAKDKNYTKIIDTVTSMTLIHEFKKEDILLP